MSWTAPGMIVSYVFLFFIICGFYEVCNTLHDIHRTLEEIVFEMRSALSWEEGE